MEEIPTCKISCFFFFFRNVNSLKKKKKKNTRKISTCSSCQSLSEHLESFDIFPLSSSYWEGLDEILKRPFEMDQSWQSGYLVTPLLFLGLFYNLIKSALCFATFQALISGLGRVKRPRQFEKGSPRPQRSRLFAIVPLFNTTQTKKKKREAESKRVIHWHIIVRT